LYHITAENTYNWDEKGWVIGQAGKTRRILDLREFKLGRLTAAAQDGSREFITLLAFVNALGWAGPPMLVYKSKSGGDLQDSWVENVPADYPAYFASTESGWTNNNLGIQWLRTVFDPATHERAQNRRRLLLVDGHSSHVNMAFLEVCDTLGIILVIMPPHSTQKLQPLDVSCFGPLSQSYTKEINLVMFDSAGAIQLSKRHFWDVFRKAWEGSFSEDNIQSGWRRTGLWPWNPELVIGLLRRPVKIEVQIINPPTPITARGLRRFEKEFKRYPTQEKVNQACRLLFKLEARNAVTQHVNKGLKASLGLEKQRRKRGKKLNLLGEEGSGTQIFDSKAIAIARTVLKAKEEAEVAEKKRKEEEKQKKAEEREELAIAKALRAQERKLKAEANKRAREEAKEAREAQKQLRKELSTAQNKGAKQPSKAGRTKPAQKVVVELDDEEEESGPVQVTKSGRVIKKKTIM
jgi:hypothetical protein